MRENENEGVEIELQTETKRERVKLVALPKRRENNWPTLRADDNVPYVSLPYFSNPFPSPPPPSLLTPQSRGLFGEFPRPDNRPASSLE